MTDPTGEGGRSARPSRRTVLRAAAWTTPVVSTVAAAPTYAASPCTTCPNISWSTFNTNGVTSAGLTNLGGQTGVSLPNNQWSLGTTARGYTAASLATDAYGFFPSTSTGPFAGKGTYFTAAADPTSSRTVSLTLGFITRPSACNTIRIGVIDNTSADADVVMSVSFGRVPAVGTYTGTAGSSTGTVDRGTQTWVIPPGAPTTGATQINLIYALGSQNYDDIGLYQVSLGC